MMRTLFVYVPAPDGDWPRHDPDGVPDPVGPHITVLYAGVEDTTATDDDLLEVARATAWQNAQVPLETSNRELFHPDGGPIEVMRVDDGGRLVAMRHELLARLATAGIKLAPQTYRMRPHITLGPAANAPHEAPDVRWAAHAIGVVIDDQAPVLLPLGVLTGDGLGPASTAFSSKGVAAAVARQAPAVVRDAMSAGLARFDAGAAAVPAQQIADARRLAAGEALDVTALGRLRGFFASSQAFGLANATADQRTAWLICGGAAGMAWVEQIAHGLVVDDEAPAAVCVPQRPVPAAMTVGKPMRIITEGAVYDRYTGEQRGRTLDAAGIASILRSWERGQQINIDREHRREAPIGRVVALYGDLSTSPVELWALPAYTENGSREVAAFGGTLWPSCWLEWRDGGFFDQATGEAIATVRLDSVALTVDPGVAHRLLTSAALSAGRERMYGTKLQAEIEARAAAGKPVTMGELATAAGISPEDLMRVLGDEMEPSAEVMAKLDELLGGEAAMAANAEGAAEAASAPPPAEQGGQSAELAASATLVKLSAAVEALTAKVEALANLSAAPPAQATQAPAATSAPPSVDPTEQTLTAAFSSLVVNGQARPDEAETFKVVAKAAGRGDETAKTVFAAFMARQPGSAMPIRIRSGSAQPPTATPAQTGMTVEARLRADPNAEEIAARMLGGR